MNGKSTILKWTKAIIHRLAQKIKEGTKFFINHGDNTNLHDNRQSVGNILASYVKKLKGKLSNVIIGHFPDANKVKDADICSMEAEIGTSDNVVDDIDEVSGIALGNSDIDSPSFPGAIRLNAIQCFNTHENNNSGEGDIMPDEPKITFQTIKQAVIDMNIYPWQLFSEDQMKQDKVFGKLYEQNTTLIVDKERLTNELKTATEKNQEAVKAVEVNKAKKLLNDLMPIGKGFTEKQKTYITKQFKPGELKDLSEESLKGFIESGKKLYAEEAKFFGVENIESEIKTRDENKDADKSVEEQALEALDI